MLEWFGAASAEGERAPASLMGRNCAALQLQRWTALKVKAFFAGGCQ